MGLRRWRQPGRPQTGFFRTEIFSRRQDRYAIEDHPAADKQGDKRSDDFSDHVKLVYCAPQPLALNGHCCARRIRESRAVATNGAEFGWLGYRGWPRRRLHSPRTARMTEK